MPADGVRSPATTSATGVLPLPPIPVSPTTSPARTVTTAYSYGKPTSVSGFAGSITYNDNGTLATIAHEKPTMSAVRAPKMMRERRSRPN